MQKRNKKLSILKINKKGSSINLIEDRYEELGIKIIDSKLNNFEVELPENINVVLSKKLSKETNNIYWLVNNDIKIEEY